ncbi:MAG: hypothetical protein AB3X44_18870 [Leptothrix sp. (in: b-proteobacteria)]
MSIPKDHSKEIHLWALGGAAIAAALPVGADAVALGAEEITMIIRIGSLFNMSIEKGYAEGVLAAAIATEIGAAAHAAVFAALEAANVGYPLTIPVKAVIAAGLIEVVGRAAYSYFEEKSKRE